MEAETLELNTLKVEPLRGAERLIPTLLDFPAIFKKAIIFQKHTILRETFKARLTYVGGVFRTPFLHAHYELSIKEKGLLFVEQPSQNFGESTGCSAIGTSFEHLQALLAVIEPIMYCGNNL